jgi:hypothetical protein
MKFRMKYADMPSSLQIMLDVRLLIDEVVLQGDYTRHAASLISMLIDYLRSLVQHSVIETIILASHFSHGNMMFSIFLDCGLPILCAFTNNFFLGSALLD